MRQTISRSRASVQPPSVSARTPQATSISAVAPMMPPVPCTGSYESVRPNETDQEDQPMKTCIKNLFAPKLIRLKAALIALTCAAVLLLTSALKAQTYAFTNFAGMPGGVGDVDGIGSAARFNQPGGVAVDSAGNVYVADTFNSTIRKITPDGEVTTLAG